MDIGTAKPSRPGDPASRHRWRLVDLCEPSQEYSVAEFQREAGRLRDELAGTGLPAVFVGGTGLYHRAVWDGLELPGRYPEIARRLEAEAGDEAGARALHLRLRELDPVAAGRMEPLNVRRVIRALEVTEGSGRRFSDFGPGLTSYRPIPTLVIGLNLERSRLDERLEARLGWQLEVGLVEEVRGLLEAPGGLSRTARQAIAYREIADHLEGRMTLEAAVLQATRRLKAFARRQQAWFRRDPRVVWLEADSPSLLADVAATWEAFSR